MVGGNEDYLLQKVPLSLLHAVPPNLQATAGPHFGRRCLDTHGLVWVSLLWGHCSFLLGPGAPKVLLVPSKSVSPVLLLKSLVFCLSDKFFVFPSSLNDDAAG